MYVAVPKGLREHYGYGNQLNDMAHDRLVCSIGDVCIQYRLLQETELTYKKAYEIAQAMEVATKVLRISRRPYLPTREFIV